MNYFFLFAIPTLVVLVGNMKALVIGISLFPDMKPLPISRMDLVTGTRSPRRILKHYLKQFVTEPMFIIKWSSIGALVVTFLYAISLLIANREADSANAKAKDVYDARLAEIKRKADIEAEKAEEKRKADEFKARTIDVTQRAIANWDQWKQSFLGSEYSTACYHGHIFNEKTMLYTVTCTVGDTGRPLPSLKIVCNQDACEEKHIIVDELKQEGRK